MGRGERTSCARLWGPGMFSGACPRAQHQVRAPELRIAGRGELPPAEWRAYPQWLRSSALLRGI